jgi:allantoinase
MTALLVRSERVMLPDGVRPATIRIDDGRIVGIGRYEDHPAGVREMDAGALVVLPGLVDTHVHINDPGRADWEGFDHATRAAAAGGVTTLVDMPLNSIPPTTSVGGLAAKRTAAAGKCHVDVGFWGGVVPGNAGQLIALADQGVLGFKCFLSPSGVDEFEHVAEPDLRGALPALAARQLPLLAHAEWPALLREPVAAGTSEGESRRYSTWLTSRPPESEHAAIDLLIRLAAEYDAHVHIVHLASATALEALSAARRRGVAITVETCPHYLTFAAEDIGDGATAFKCAPPIRERAHREELWKGLVDGDIDFIATDHSPAPPPLKHLADGDFLRAWGGVASLQIGLAAVWTGMTARNLPIHLMGQWLASGPARLAGLGGTKGAITAGCDADLVIWDPEAIATIDGSALYHRHPITPYDGARLRGRVKTTLLRGAVIFADDECRGTPAGRLIVRN